MTSGRRRGGRAENRGAAGGAALATGVGLLAYASQLLRDTELQTIDARFSIRGTQQAPSNIVLVEME